MNKPVIARPRLILMLFLWLALYSAQAFAAAESAGVLDNVLARFQTAANTWGTIITQRATWLFWLLVVISMVWTFGMMALRKADIGEIFAEFIRFTIFTGFFWWLLQNGPRFAVDIMTSLRMIAAQASGLPNALAPSGIVDIGFDIFYKVVDQSSVWKPMDSLFGLLLSCAILIVFALVGTNMLLLLVSGWLFAYAGVFILGFGGSRWTSEMAIGYFKSILNIALQLFTMVLLVGIGKSFVDQYYASMSAGMTLKELAVMAVVAAVLLFLVAKIPPQIGALAGGSTGSLGSNFGVGAAVGAAAMGAAAVATAGAAVAAGAASAAGGAQALMAAVSKAGAAERAGGASSSLIDAATGAGAGAGESSGGSALAAAMGDSGGGGSTGAAMGSWGGSASNSPSYSADTSSGGGSSEASGGEASGKASTGAGGGSGEGSQADAGSGSGNGSGSGSGGGSGEASANSSAKGEAGASGETGKPKPAGSASKAGALAAKAGRIAAGTAANLAQGSWDVAKGKALDMKDAAMERIGETTGGKIAAAIKARQAAEAAGQADDTAKFDGDSLSAGKTSAEDEEEIAAFRDGKSQST